jgi:hypothetical protein
LRAEHQFADEDLAAVRTAIPALHPITRTVELEDLDALAEITVISEGQAHAVARVLDQAVVVEGDDRDLLVGERQ